MSRVRVVGTVLLLVCISLCSNKTLAAETYASHAPVRPLPEPSQRPAANGPAYYVDAAKGNDSSNGSVAKPWKTVKHALGQLKPGDTLYLRGGTYYESLAIKVLGTKEKPVTIRSYPNELAIIDGGYREFFENPATAWEPVAGGAPDEYQSTKTYTEGGGFGNFGDSMLPFQRYMPNDLGSTNELFSPELSNRTTDNKGIYAGPGSRRDEAGRIHIRLAHTKLEGLGENAYTGETDPRKLQLVIAGADEAVNVAGSENLRLQDLVFRGGSRQAVKIENASNIEFDGCTLYGSGACIRTGNVNGLKIVNSALRGHGAPWHARFHHKDRSKSGYLFFGTGSNVEFANCELTDHHDGLALRGYDGFKMHHCLLENFNDDGIEPGPKLPKGQWLIYCNYITRTLSPFTAHGKKPEQVTSDPGSGVYVYRNIFDFREGIYFVPPAETDSTGAYLNRQSQSALHDHGSPTQQNYYVYQNTFIMPRQAWRGSYAFGWGNRVAGTTRRVFNNICFQVEGIPGMTMSVTPSDDFQADGNLHWSLREGPTFKGDLFGKVRSTEAAINGKNQYPAGWTANDQFADPSFVSFDEDASKPSDFRIKPESKAINAGVNLPDNWPDEIRAKDADKPDIGAVPAGIEPWRIGVNGRFSAFGQLIGK